MKRVVVKCYQCRHVRDRAQMLATYVGKRLSWLCKPCATRHDALARLNRTA